MSAAPPYCSTIHGGDGQVIATGTVGRGSGLELYRRLQPGDTVEMEVEGIGTLRNTLAEPVGSRWAPERKEPAGYVAWRPPRD